MLVFLVINDDIEEAVIEVKNIIECTRVYSKVRKFSMKGKENIEFKDKFYT